MIAPMARSVNRRPVPASRVRQGSLQMALGLAGAAALVLALPVVLLLAADALGDEPAGGPGRQPRGRRPGGRHADLRDAPLNGFDAQSWDLVPAPSPAALAGGFGVVGGTAIVLLGWYAAGLRRSRAGIIRGVR